MSIEWFKLETFDLEKYLLYSKVRNGDLSEMIPNKMYAFSAPFLEKKDKYGVIVYLYRINL